MNYDINMLIEIKKILFEIYKFSLIISWLILHLSIMYYQSYCYNAWINNNIDLLDFFTKNILKH